MDFRLFHLIATVVDACDQQPSPGPGHPPTETIRVVAALRRFLREGTPWRSLRPLRIRPAARPCAAASGAGPRGVCWRRFMPCWPPCCAATPT